MNDKSKAPNFLGLIDENECLSLDNFKGKYLVIYFYPKDKTSGCTIESQDFRDHYKKFKEVNIFPKLWKKKSKNVVLRFVASFELDKNIIDEIDKRLDILKKVRNI